MTISDIQTSYNFNVAAGNEVLRILEDKKINAQVLKLDADDENSSLIRSIEAGREIGLSLGELHDSNTGIFVSPSMKQLIIYLNELVPKSIIASSKIVESALKTYYIAQSIIELINSENIAEAKNMALQCLELNKEIPVHVQPIIHKLDQSLIRAQELVTGMGANSTERQVEYLNWKTDSYLHDMMPSHYPSTPLFFMPRYLSTIYPLHRISANLSNLRTLWRRLEKKSELPTYELLSMHLSAMQRGERDIGKGEQYNSASDPKIRSLVATDDILRAKYEALSMAKLGLIAFTSMNSLSRHMETLSQ